MAPLLLHAMSGGMVVTAPPPLPAALQATLLPPALTPRWRGAGVQVVVGVDWEGSGFEDEDLAAFLSGRMKPMLAEKKPKRHGA